VEAENERPVWREPWRMGSLQLPQAELETLGMAPRR